MARSTRLGDYRVHRIGEDRYLKEWYVSVIDRVTPDFAVGEQEIWLHVDLSEQTLVAYRGRTPIYGTLVSNRRSRPRDPARTLPDRAEVRRQYDGQPRPRSGRRRLPDRGRALDAVLRDSLALHAAFWHDRFGVARSHGCVNLAPVDAHYLFDLTSLPCRTAGTAFPRHLG